MLYVLPLLAEPALAGYAYSKTAETVQSMAAGEQSVDPRHWTTSQRQTALQGTGAGAVGMVLALNRGDIRAITYVLARKSVAKVVLPVYGAYVVHDTVMNPQSEWYIHPTTPLIPKGGPLSSSYRSSVPGKLHWTVATKLAKFFS